LFAGKDEPLLVWRDALFVLDLRLDVVDGIRSFHVKCDRLAGEGLHEDLHSTPQTQDQMECALLLDIVI